jgi:hypothetical protein
LIFGLNQGNILTKLTTSISNSETKSYKIGISNPNYIDGMIPAGYDSSTSLFQLGIVIKNISNQAFTNASATIAEKIVLVFFKGEVMAFYHFSKNNVIDFRKEVVNDNRSTIPLTPQQYVIQKMFEAAIGIFISFTIETIIEKNFTYDHDCDWISSVQNVFSKTPPWKYFLWAWEGMVSNSYSAAFIGAVGSGINYLMTTTNFNSTDLFNAMILGGIMGFCAGVGVKLFAKLCKGVAAYTKVAISTIEAEFSNLVRHLFDDPKMFLYWKQFKARKPNLNFTC